MSACAYWRELLEDQALGSAASVELQAHLAVCAACAAALAALRAQVSQLDTGVRQLVAIEPSQHLESRLLAAIKSRPERFGLFERWRTALAALAFGAILVVLAYSVRNALVSRGRRETFRPPTVVLSAWRSPTESLLRSPAEPLLKAAPRLGESYFEMKMESRMPKREKGEKHAN